MKAEVGQIYEGKITSITNFGAFIALPDGPDGMVHISEISDTFVKDIHDVCSVGQVVKVKVLSVADNGKIALSIKKAQDKPKDSSDDSQKRSQSQRRTQHKPSEHKPKTSAPVLYPDGVWEEQASDDRDFEDLMSKFKKSSQDRMSDLKRGHESRGYSRKSGHSSGRK